MSMRPTPEQKARASSFDEAMSLADADTRSLKREIADLRRKLAEAEFTGDRTEERSYNEAMKRAELAESRLNTAREALIKLWKHTPQIDNGYCAVCRCAPRVWLDVGKNTQRAAPCQDSRCLSHVVESALAATDGAPVQNPWKAEDGQGDRNERQSRVADWCAAAFGAAHAASIAQRGIRPGRRGYRGRAGRRV